MKVGIINYGLGNLKSLEMIIKNLGYDVEVIFSPKNLKNLDKAILPGVGSYSQAMKLINANFWNEQINEFAVEKKFLLGICLGMQILSSSGEEIKETKGLDIIKGKVVSLKSLNCNERIPHIGWNSIKNKIQYYWMEYLKIQIFILYTATSLSQKMITCGFNYKLWC